MDKINNIFGIKNKPTVELRTPERQSIEQTEDYAVKKVVNTQEGTVEKVPVNDNDIVNKLYCDNNGGGGNPFDQDLNTTDDVTFRSVLVFNDLSEINTQFDNSGFFATDTYDASFAMGVGNIDEPFIYAFNSSGTLLEMDITKFTYKGDDVLTTASGVLTSMPSLQDVTDSGNSTTNDLSVERSESAGYVTFAARNTADDGHTEFMLGNDESAYAGFVAMAGSATGAAFWFDIGTGSNCGIGFWVNNLRQVVIDNNGQVGIGTDAPTSPLQIINIPSYADNAAAITGGLTVGAVYRTGDILKIVH